MSSGINLFSYATDDDSADCDHSEKEAFQAIQDKKIKPLETKTSPVANQVKSEQPTTTIASIIMNNEKKGIINEAKRVDTKRPTNISVKLWETNEVLDSGQWKAVFDSNSQEYYYWNKTTNVTTWEKPECLKYEVNLISTEYLQQQVKNNTIVSSGKTFSRCSVCNGWGMDLVRPSGMCDHCQCLLGSSQVNAASTQPASKETAVFSRAAEILGIQESLRLNKKRSDGNIPLSRRDKQQWELGVVDPLFMNEAKDGEAKCRKRY